MESAAEKSAESKYQVQFRDRHVPASLHREINVAGRMSCPAGMEPEENKQHDPVFPAEGLDSTRAKHADIVGTSDVPVKNAGAVLVLTEVAAGEISLQLPPFAPLPPQCLRRLQKKPPPVVSSPEPSRETPMI